tara:strand:+ start:1202 stop:1480 length:279 start_codon:yes stop_codon:yes gene_type:complete
MIATRDSHKIWRIYGNKSFKNETRVLFEHIDGTDKCTGYDGDINKWSEHNKHWRFGCAQVVQDMSDGTYQVLYNGYLSDDEVMEVIDSGVLK